MTRPHPPAATVPPDPRQDEAAFTPPDQPPTYVLQTGSAGAERLDLLDAIYGTTTRAALLDAGLRPGMRVLDVGCGTGAMARLAAEVVGPEGQVIGLDQSPEQVLIAGARYAGVPNLEFMTGNASQTDLADGSFDFVCCRMLLMHVTDPLGALREFGRLVRPGGVVACAEVAMDTAHFEPGVPSYERLFALGFDLAKGRGVDFNIGRRLLSLFREAGFDRLDIREQQPAFLRGDGKRSIEMTVAEVAPHLTALGMATREEVEELLAALREAVLDESTLLRVARMTHVWARRSR